MKILISGVSLYNNLGGPSWLQRILPEIASWNMSKMMQSVRKLLKGIHVRARNTVLPVQVHTVLLFWWYLLSTGSLKRCRCALRLFGKPIVIGGCGRSGTTLLLSILSCHPKLFVIGDETWTLCHRSRKGSPNERTIIRIHGIMKYIVQQALHGTYERWCEKSPGNVRVYGRLLDYFGPDLRILNIVRDGRDVILSRHPSNSEKFYITPSRWIRDVQAGRELEGHPQVLTVRYEDLVQEQESTLRRICRFLDIDFVGEFNGYPKTRNILGSVEKNAWFGEATPINAKSVGKWRKCKHRDRVNQLLCLKEARDLLAHYEYIRQ